MGEPLDASERRQLCDLLLEVGPDAPTLCEGWTAGDLAAHLYLREHFRRWPPDRIAAARAGGFGPLVDRVRSGPPAVPWRIPGVRRLLNGLEYFLHHEDVRRANGREPRPGVEELERMAWGMTGYMGRRLRRRMRPFGLVLVRPDGARRAFGDGPAITLSGAATELALYLSGRRTAARVDIRGPDDAIVALEGADTRL